MREEIISGSSTDTGQKKITGNVLQKVGNMLSFYDKSTLKPVFNLTGTILHTNLGRALLPESAIEAVIKAAGNPVNLEFDLEQGERGERDSHIETLIRDLTGAEAATAVNNNAAAVLLVFNTLALGREVPVSRGELVEIGGSFRIPEVMERSGCKLVEIGATNRTHLKDYEKSINDNTALLLKVHTSNYSIEGFTSEVSEIDIAGLARKNKIPFVIDMGSGCLVNLSQYGLPAEQTVAQVIAAGADIVTFSGDKLLGGPQCGIIAGRKDLVDKIRCNPLKRALRPDKITLAALAEVLRLYRNPDTLETELPTIRFFTRPQETIREQCERLVTQISSFLPDRYAVSVEDCTSQIGSGAIPVEGIPSTAIVISSMTREDEDIRRLADAMRWLSRPVIGRIHNGSLLLDMRCLENETEFSGQLKELKALLS